MPKLNTTKDEVIALYRTGKYLQKDLAKRFSVSPQAIHHLLHLYAPKSLMKKIKAIKHNKAEKNKKIRGFGNYAMAKWR